MPHKPEGYNSLSPYVIADGAQRVIDFLKATFDAEELRRFDHEDGSIMHAELRIIDSVVMITDATSDWPPSPAMIHVYVPDVDGTYQRALAAGGEAIQAPQQKGDPDKRGGVKDPAGNSWWIATQVG